MGELGVIRRYAYWSERKIVAIAADNGIPVDRSRGWKAKLGSVPLIGSTEFIQEARDLTRAEKANRIETALGAAAVADFVTPPSVRFAKGIGHVEFAQFIRPEKRPTAVVIHTTVCSSSGNRVGICLFGSLDNTAGFIGGSDKPPGGWTSSSMWAIDSLIKSRGAIIKPMWDEESLAIEALKIATQQGVTGRSQDHAGQPWTRGFTLGSTEASEWLAEIYLDVEVDKVRWNLQRDGISSPDVSRILVGAPLWVRTPGPDAVTRYRDLRR